MKEDDFEAKKNKLKKQLSNFVCMYYGSFTTRNESKATIDTQKSDKINNNVSPLTLIYIYF